MSEISVYICHDHSIDQHIAHLLLYELEANHIDVFGINELRDEYVTPPNELHDIKRRSQTHFIPLFSPATVHIARERYIWVGADWLSDEIADALQYVHKIVPVFLHNFAFSDYPTYFNGTLQPLLDLEPFIWEHCQPQQSIACLIERLRTQADNNQPRLTLATDFDPELAAYTRTDLLKQTLNWQVFRPSDAQLEAESYFQWAVSAHLNEQYTDALDHLNHALELDPTAARIYTARSKALRFLNRLPEALKDAETALQLEPENAIHYRELGNIHSYIRDYDSALLSYSRAIDLNPLLTNIYTNRAFARCLVGDYKGAIRDVGQALKINPKSMASYLNRSVAYFCLGNYDDALADLQHYEKVNPNNPMLLSRIAIVYFAMGNSEKAFYYWQRLVEQDQQFLEIIWTSNYLYNIPPLVNILDYLISQFKKSYLSE